ncbi:MAG: HAD hydrolase-like protein [Planctomycetota bacterium]
MNRSLDLFVFDLAGTTVVDDDHVLRAFERTAAAHGIATDRLRLKPRMGWHKLRVFETLLAEVGRATDAAPAMAERFEREFAAVVADAPLRPTAGAVAAIRGFAEAGVKVAFNTGFARNTADLVLRAVGWQHLPSVASDEVAHGRPAPDLILAAMARAAVTDPRRVGVAGDTPSDLEAGTAAGCRFVVGVGHGTHTLEELRRCKHTHLLPTLEGLLPLILDDPTEQDA